MKAQLVVGGILLLAGVGCTAGTIHHSVESQYAVVRQSHAGEEPDHGERKTFPRINQTEEGIAIHGYDPVAYFMYGKPTLGCAEHEATWMGATWRFANSRHRDLFITQPHKYAPQYGGYCSLGVSVNILDNGSPTAWKIVRDKLYFNYNGFYHVLWKLDPLSIARADKNWPPLQDVP